MAVVDAANCNGCRRCFADCPYAAITMVPHPNQRIGRTLAQVDADLCAGCGICAGACPSSTPFRSAAQLVTGIDMPQLTVERAARAPAARRCSRLDAPRPLVRLRLRPWRARAARLAAPTSSPFSLLCTGQLPPSFVEYALRDGAAGVLVAACREGGCEFRLGERWTAERLRGAARAASARLAWTRERIDLVFAGPGDEAELAQAVRSPALSMSQPASPAEPSASHA